jgi:hypothetical protein
MATGILRSQNWNGTITKTSEKNADGSDKKNAYG